ncbi:rhomboid family intramembrane serine protease [Staphylococcus schleiferi subsp. coagulans]|uniref:Rhomboid family intramembrane serine protease n=1 Tax=Staphylococcus coagulans TaxID=74706 RepID=A0A9X0PDC0_9STAP|nr:rhomboid family intramembrane serine protease [Staphylococcus coagulans]MBA8775665.1 rhomboid family intramembrane serine protease [Staphylococcus coagulans]
MFEEKHLWKASFLWIKYLNYECIHFDQDKGEIWLGNKKQNHIIIFKQGHFTTQELEFDKERLISHHDDITNFIGYNANRYDVYVMTEKSFNPTQFNVHQPVRVRFHCIDSIKAFDQMSDHFLIKRNLRHKDNKTEKEYKKRVLNPNIIERAMYRFTPVTYVLIFINVLIWLIVTFFTPHHTDYEIINLGALSHFNVVHGEWYRLLSSIFLHIDFQHLLFNMLSLYIFGKLVESFVGSLKMLGIYFFSGIFGNLLSLSFITKGFSLGASRAIFGLIGALLALMIISKRFERKMMLQMILAVLIMTGITLLIQNVNVVAHLGGLIGGGLITYLGYSFVAMRKYFYILVAFTIVITIGMLVKIYTTPDINIYNQIIQDEMYSNHFSEAKDMVKQTYHNGYADDMTYYLSGLIIATQESKAEAMAEWEHGVKLFPNSTPLNYELAIANRSLGDNKKAKKYLSQVLKNDPKNKDYINLKKELDD